jgi:hypothetical protein
MWCRNLLYAHSSTVQYNCYPDKLNYLTKGTMYKVNHRDVENVYYLVCVHCTIEHRGSTDLEMHRTVVLIEQNGMTVLYWYMKLTMFN